jgi:hypothetical protein
MIMILNYKKAIFIKMMFKIIIKIIYIIELKVLKKMKFLIHLLSQIFNNQNFKIMYKIYIYSKIT